MSSTIVTLLSVITGFLFMLTGTLLLCPVINEDIYNELKKEFVESSKVFPFAAQTGFKPDPQMYRMVIGSIEFGCGLLLAAVSGTLKELANIVLLVIMGGAIYTHWALGHGIDKMAPGLVLGFLLTCRFLLTTTDSEEARQKKQQ